MDNQRVLTTSSYFWMLTKIFFRSAFAYYFKRDDNRLEELYYETLDIQEQYIDIYCDEEDKAERLKEKVYEMLALILLKEQRDVLYIKSTGKTFRGLKLRENIIHDIYAELWLLGQNFWIYTFEGRDQQDKILPFDIEKPYPFRIDQVYQCLKKHREPGLLCKLYEKEKRNKK